MKKAAILILALVLVVFSGCGQTVSTQVGDPVFGDFVTVDMENNPVDPGIFSGHRLTMVNIWGTFCGPCVEEMPALARLKDVFGTDFQIVGIIVDGADKNGNLLPEKKAAAATIIAQTGADYPHLLPSASLISAHLKDVQTVPETVFVDENGNMIGSPYYGAKTEEQWKKIIATLLESQ